jgi:GNAT superfamily N-acetyltransferase
VVRRARPEDLTKVAACAKAAYSLYLPRLDRPPAPMLADYAELIAAGEVYVLESDEPPSDEQLGGFIVIRPLGGSLFVENVAVDPARQGQGYGRRLMAFAETYAGVLGLPALRLYTNEVMHENIPFYQILGFAVTERVLEDGYRRIYLEKPLA